MNVSGLGHKGLFAASLDALAAVDSGYFRTGTSASGPDFAVGEFRVRQPPEVRTALLQFLDYAQISGYGPPCGLGQLREAVLDDLGLDRARQDVLVTAGGKEALWIALQIATADRHLLKAGQVVALVPKPGWQPYRIISYALGLKVIGYDPTEIARDERALLRYREFAPDIVVLNFPNNPTGAEITQRQLNTVVETCRHMRASIVSDEVYRVLGNGSTVGRCPLVDSHDVIVESASKWLAAANLRVGFLSGGIEQVSRAAAFRATYASGISDIDQRMALALIQDDVCVAWLAQLRAELRATRQVLCSALGRLGVDVSSSGGFYLWARGCPDIELGKGPKAAVADGASFGDGQHVRICCARSVEDVEGAARAIARVLLDKSDK